MDDTSELVKNFENILKKTSHRSPISLYSGVNVRAPEPAYSCQEVLTTVSRQLKAIQNADCVTNKSVPKNLIKFKSSTFLPVNMLPRSSEVPSKPENASTFETQCVSDTQLIHIIQDVEALHTHNGITQEFDMPFCHIHAENEGSTNKEPMFPIIDISLKEPDPNKSYHILSPDKDVNNIAVKIETQPEDTQLIKECIEIENIEQPDNLIEDTNVPDTNPSSPILNIKRIKKPNTKSIVVDLDIFEKFEKIAVPLVKETEDINSAKELINSQIIGKELCLQSNLEPILNEIHTYDFIQELTNEKSGIQVVTSDKNDNTAQVDTKSKENSQVSDKFILKDEILFSSDEEEEYMHKSVQDLPFTCALETSFYEQSDVLDKTMFVSFQTASNKSIQICSESFSKAKNMLEDVSKETSKEPTLTEMVNICDSFNTKQVSNVIDENFVSKTEEIKDRVTENIVCDFIDFESNGKANSQVLFHDENLFQSTNDINSETKNEVFSQKRKFDGFKTASNKRTKLCDKALEKSKKIFQDIDLNTSNFEMDDTKFKENTNNDSPINIKSDIVDINMALLASEKPEAESSEVLQPIKIDDVTILKEFENVEMDAQFSNQTKDSENVQLIGFKTASNKNIEISKIAMEKTNKIFQDVEFGNKIDENINKSKAVAFIESAVQSNMGFRTASNKQINVSEQALATMKNIFRDIETIDVKNTDTEVSAADKVKNENIKKKNTIEGRLGFRTASNNEIDISEEAFSKSKNIFRDVERGNSFEVIKEQDHKAIKHEGFKTASNKKVSISAKAMARTRNIFENLDEDETKNLLIDEDPVEPPFYGFGYPKNKEVDMIEEELARDKTIFEEFELNDDFDKNKDKFIESNNPVFQGFQTASKKPLKISTEALARSKNIFKDIDLIEEKCDKNTEKNEHIGSNKHVKLSDKALINIRNVFQDMDTEILTMSEKEDNVFQFQGFQTASKKPVKVSDDALAKSRKIFQDIDKDVPVEINSKSELGFQTVIDKPIGTTEEFMSKGRKSITDENMEISSKFQGFQTANNKPVSISEEALAKSRNIFQDIESSRLELQSNIKPEKNPSTKFVGFQTASNKAVNISESALAKSRKLFEDLDEAALNIETKNPALITKFEGFQTASNKHVNISEESLVKSKQLFQEIGKNYGNIIKNDEDNHSSSKLVGFQTASNKKVKVSEEALNKCRKIFQDLNGDDKEDLVNEAASLKCFQTASNKPVAVSEQALLKSRKIFQDVDLSDDNGKNKHQAANENVSFSKRKNITKNEEDKIILSQIIEFKPATNNNSKISEQSPKPEKISNDLGNNQNQTELESKKLTVNERDKGKNVTTYEFNLQNIINTQVMTNFEETLYTEDFLKETTPKSNKRSGSPILSCPKAKRRKRFEIPYSQKPVEEKKVTTEETLDTTVQNHETPVNFDKNYKKIKKYTLKDLERMENESNNEKEIDPYILEFNFENLLKFEFFGKRNDIRDKKWTVEDLKRVFLEYVNRKLIPDGWIDNHLKLILWKLISYEIRYPKTMKYTCSAKNVIEQLKYRYRRELYDAERPALRKILEKDDTSMRTIVLCVVAIFEDGVSVSSATNPSNIELLLTDGWYCIKACVDRMLATLVCAGKIVVGTKLATHGAELVNCEQGVSPWEDTTSIRLKLSGNSTRRARWHARLGYHGNAAILSQLSNVRSDGGRVARLRTYVARVYSPLYVEKFASGSTVTRSERLEHLHQARYEAERQSLLEKLYEDVEKEFSLQSQYSEKQYDSPRQRERLLQDIQARVQEKMESQGLEVTRNVVPLLKMRVVGVAEKGGVVEVTKAMIAIWKPNEAVLEIIGEGAWIEVMNVVPTAVRYSELQLSAGRQSVFSQSKFKETEKIKPYLKALKRTCYTIKNLAKNPSMSTEYNEIDTVGFIFLIEPSKEFDPNKHQFQNVYLTDAEKNMICINFWGGLKKFGFENVLDTGQVVSCTNLQKRAGNTRKNIPQYRVTEFSYFTKTPKTFEARKSIEDLSRLFNGIDINKYCEECLNLKNNYVAKMQGRYENISPYRFPNIDINSSKNRMFIDSPLAQKPIKIDDLNLTGLDFESTFKQTDTQDLSPKTLLRKMQVKEKLAKLKMYGEPPALSPIHIMNKSKNAGSAFKSPLISKSEVSPSVASEHRNLLKQKEDEIQCSPVLSMNRTYVKKNSNPVKLNFSNSAMDETNASEIDHFAEEFDGSPPLSLD